jgi:hypothetical protein
MSTGGARAGYARFGHRLEWGEQQVLYLVSGTLRARELLSKPHEEFVQFVQKTIVPSLQLLVQFRSEGTLLAGGVRASTQDVVMVLSLPGAESHLVVRRLLTQLPMFPYYDWQVTPLESFEEWARQFNAG